MSYLNLYRRWRPQKFSEVTAQPHITRTLSHALSRESVSHAYLFCGPRGTGKTTVAKILAKAINCDYYPAPEPCDGCQSCLRIKQGASLDVNELDAASNRGIEEIRELKEKSRYASASGRYKVYIIDEAHMLTSEAFNALLKTLEEPPPRVVFILATTEPSRLPSTVVSRCQRFDFRLLKDRDIIERMESIICEEHWECEYRVLPLIARLSGGAMRDALGLLEQVQVYADGKITAQHVYDLTGMPGAETLDDLAAALVEDNLVAGLEAIREVTYGGKDINLFVKEVLYFFTRLLIAGNSKEVQNLDESRVYSDYLEKYRGCLSSDALLEIVTIAHSLSTEIKFSDSPHFQLEVAFLKMIKACRQSGLASVEQWKERIEQLEQEIRTVKKDTPPAARSSPSSKTEENRAVENSMVEPAQETPPDSQQEKQPGNKNTQSEKSRKSKKAEAGGEVKQEEKEKTETEMKEKGIDAQENPKALEESSSAAEGGTFSGDLMEEWERVLRALGRQKQRILLGMVQEATPLKFSEGKLVLSLKKEQSFNKDMIMNKKRQELEQVIFQEMGQKFTVSVVLSENEEGQEKTTTHGGPASSLPEDTEDNTETSAEKGNDKEEETRNENKGSAVGKEEETNRNTGKEENSVELEEEGEDLVKEALRLFNGTMVEPENNQYKEV